MRGTNRDLLLDCVRVYAMLMVVMIHLPGTHDLLQYICPFDVNALFAILAGMFFSCNVDIHLWLVKRWHRLVVPYLIWESVYIVIGIAFDVACRKFVVPDGVTFCRWLLCGSASVQLWFIAALMYAQLFLFLL